MDIETGRQGWEKAHSDLEESFHTNVLDQGLNYKPAAAPIDRRKLLYGLTLEAWREEHFKIFHPYRYRVRQGAKKIVGFCDQAFHWTWYWSVYFYYLILYFFLFLGPGYSSDRDSFPESDPSEKDQTV